MEMATRYMTLHFNSHPHEEDDQKGCICIRAQVYFNSHPHEEDDSDLMLAIMELNISTHILTKRMTIRESVRKLIALHFNSHPHEEDDILFTI